MIAPDATGATRAYRESSVPSDGTASTALNTRPTASQSSGETASTKKRRTAAT